MTEKRSDVLKKVVESLSLESRQKPINLDYLAKSWGVTSIEKQPMASEAMLLPGTDGYRIVLNEVSEKTATTRQRFSFAHELGHLFFAKERFPEAIQFGDEAQGWQCSKR